MLHKLLLTLVSLLAAAPTHHLLAQESVFLPMHASRIRAIGMASAYQAARDDLATISFNPASYSVYREPKVFRVTFFLTPASPFLIYQKPQDFFARESHGSEKAFAALLSLVKAINITYKDLDFGLLLGEPAFSQTALLQQKQAVHLNGVYNNHYNAAVLRIRLAEQVAIGASLYLNYFENAENRREHALSASYGVTLQPNDYLRVGVSLFSASARLPRSYEFIDEKYNDAIGLGLALQTPWNMKIGLDIRNLTVNQDVVGERFLAGLEQNFLNQVAFRAGVQYNTGDKSFTQTFGIGLLNLSRFRSDNQRFTHTEYAINYALIRKKLFDVLYLIHSFNFQVRI